MIPLRAYVMLWSGDLGWQVSVCHDLDAIRHAWKERVDPDRTAGVLHIGFDRPLSHQFEDVARQWPGRMLVTTAAKHALPISFESTASTVGTVEAHGLHLATKGWGYTVSDQELARAVQAASNEVLPENSLLEIKGWVASLVAAEPMAEAPLRKADVYDESSYLLHESKLEREFRHMVGLFRYRALVEPDAKEPAAILRAAPPWLLSRPIVNASMSVRAFNVLHSNDVKTFADLLGYSIQDFLSLPNFGRKSVEDLRSCLLDCLNEGPADVETKIAKASTKTLVSLIEQALAEFDERDADIFVRRLGFRRRMETLQSIANDYDITRERVRQVEVRCVRRLQDFTQLNDLLISKLGALLNGREYPIPVLGLEVIDPWFQGLAGSPSLIRSLIANFCAEHLNVVKIDGIEYIARITQEDWDYALYEARQTLASGAGQNWPEERCRAMVSAALKETACELRGLLWDKARTLCHFSDAGDGSRVLLSYEPGSRTACRSRAVRVDAAPSLHGNRGTGSCAFGTTGGCAARPQCRRCRRRSAR